MKQSIPYVSSNLKRTQLYTENQEFYDFFGPIFVKHLHVDVDEDGTSVSMESDHNDYEGKPMMIMMDCEDYVEILIYDEKNDKESDLILTKDQLLIIGTFVEDAVSEAENDYQDACDLQRDPYSYYGVSRRDFY